MQDWLSTAVSVLVILLVSVFMLRRFSRKTGNAGSVSNAHDDRKAGRAPPDSDKRGNDVFFGEKEAEYAPKGSPVQGDAVERADSPDQSQGKYIAREHHPVSRKSISDNALKVLHRLNSQGYEAYLVGGCIRDIYLGLRPKDFDVATNATPEDVRRLFRNSRLIGRRFKLVHIMFGRETIEVATFRASHNVETHGDDGPHSQHSESGRILRDNVYGTMEDDAIRRDFTINALYYDSRDFSVVDHCEGVRDIEQGKLRLIGDPVRRYHEDPVRMLRAIRFAAKLGFTMVPGTSEPIGDLAYLLGDIPSARLFDEVVKLLQSGHGVETLKLLREYGLLEHLFPATSQCLESGDEQFQLLIHHALVSTDTRVQRDRPVTPAFLFAALFWSPLQRLAYDIRAQGVPPVPALQQAAMTVLENQSRHTSIPKRFTIAVREIWDLQGRLERRQPRAIDSILEHPRFRAAYDFLLLREESGEQLGNAGQWWTDMQDSADEDRQQLIHSLRDRKEGKGGRKRRRRRKPKTHGETKRGVDPSSGDSPG